MDIKTLLTYSTAAQTRLYEFLLAVPDACAHEFDTLADFKSIRDLLAHVNGAEQRWTWRITGGYPPSKRYELDAPKKIPKLYADWQDIRAITTAAVRAADEAELSRSIDIVLGTGGPAFPLTVEQILFHTLNHENFHRGQCSTFLQLQQIDPPFFDFIWDFMKR